MVYNSQPVADANKITWDRKMGLADIDCVRKRITIVCICVCSPKCSRPVHVPLRLGKGNDDKKKP